MFLGFLSGTSIRQRLVKVTAPCKMVQTVDLAAFAFDPVPFQPPCPLSLPIFRADLSMNSFFFFFFFFSFFFSLLRAPRRSRLSLDASPRRGGQAVGQRSSSPLRRQVRQVGRGAKSEAWQLVHLGCTRFLWLVSNRSSPRARPAATGFGVLISFAGDYHTEQQTFVPPLAR